MVLVTQVVHVDHQCWFGYVAGGDITNHATKGIQIAVNLIPAVVYVLAFIPVAMYKLEQQYL